VAHFPEYHSSHRNGAKGVLLLEEWVHRVSGWILRRVPQEADFGIDAYLDVVTNAQEVVGRSLAVQVKCGASFLARRTESGYSYYGEFRHFNVFMNHPVPVILLVVDPETSSAWWVQFSPQATQGTESGWKIEIPFHQKLGGSTVADWERIAGPHRDHVPDAIAYWKTMRKVKHADFVLWEIKRRDVEAMRFGEVEGLFERLAATPSMIRSKRNAVEIVIGGYDQDPRELWEIPEVRRWFKVADFRIKYWFYFLRTDKNSSSLETLINCVCDAIPLSFDAKLDRWKLMVNADSRHAFLRQHYAWLNEFTAQHCISAEINASISASVAQVLGAL
jgi:hypothetical protein